MKHDLGQMTVEYIGGHRKLMLEYTPDMRLVRLIDDETGIRWENV